MEYEVPDLVGREIVIDLGGLLIFTNEQSENEQVGYSVSKYGEPLFGFDEGDWQEGWYVIGRETTCGDPVFLDLNDVGLPVYTSAHGMGDWDANCIADSYEDFMVVIKAIEDAVTNRKIPLDRLKVLMSEIKDTVGEESLEFWNMLLDDMPV